MRTSTINYRVADFLKRFPPFEFLDEPELLELASHGRVKMHQRGEALFWEGREPGPFVFVIQQGTVRLVNDTDDGEELRDILGAGELLGVGRFLGRDTYPYTARAASDVVVYCLEARDLERLIDVHNDVARYLEATGSVRVRHGAERPDDAGRRRQSWIEQTGPARPPTWIEQTGPARPPSWIEQTGPARPPSWIEQTGPAGAVITRRLSTCGPGTTIKAAARQMAAEGRDALVVVDADRLALGVVTTDDFRDHVATARVAPDARIDAIMQAAPPTASPNGRVGDYLLVMMQAGVELAAVTADGTTGTPVEGLVTSRDLVVRHGADPAGLALDLRRAPSFSELAALHGRIRGLVVEQLVDAASLGWLLPAVGELHGALVRRVVELATADCVADGLAPLELDTCWLHFGSAGRQELLTAHDADYGLVYADPPTGAEAQARAQVDALTERVGTGLRAAGFRMSSGSRPVDPLSWCQPRSVWTERFSGWIHDPVRQQIYLARALFDLRGLAGPSPLVRSLHRHLVVELDRTDAFIPVLANDTLSNQPPLTFFEGLVVDDEERTTSHLDIVRSALGPLTDIARVFALDAADVETVSTYRRLEQAAARHSEHRAVLEEAAEAFRIALFHRARAGLRAGHDGALIDPASLTRYERTVLKSAFRAVTGLLELTERRFLLART